MILELPYPPSVNHYWRHVGHKVLISAEGRDYRERVLASFVGSDFYRRGFTGNERLSVAIDAHAPDNRRRDLDNVLKALLDALQHAGAYGDDSQIDELTIRRKTPLEIGKVVVTVQVITGIDSKATGVAQVERKSERQKRTRTGDAKRT